MEKGEVNFESAEGKALLRSLHVYAYELFRRVYKQEVNERGKSFSDYVFDAIEKHLRGEDNYDKARSTLDYHLKKNVIRQAIYNDLPPHVKNHRKLVSKQSLTESNIVPIPSAAREQSVSAVIPELLAYDEKVIFQEIERVIGDDKVVGEIYLAITTGGFSLVDRAEICRELDMKLSDFDNGKRRLNTILKNVFRKFNLDIRLDYEYRKK